MNWLVLLLGTVGVILVSQRALRLPGHHGFFRAFAFEGLIFMLALNLEVWFVEPLSLRQVFSWALLLGSALLAWHGYRLLNTRGAPRQSEPGSANYAFENTSQLVQQGAYRYIRHPMYFSLFLLATGIFLKGPGLLPAALGGAVFAFLLAAARAEEAENLSRFGEVYREYSRHTKLFVPFLI